MLIFFIFIFFLLLENLIIPALIGSAPFLITIIFMLGVAIYSEGWKSIALRIIPLVLAEEFFIGAGFGYIIMPLGITILIYIWINKFIDFEEGLRGDISFYGTLLSSLILFALAYIYSWIFILINGGYDFRLSWTEWLDFANGSIFYIIAWSIAVSIIFKYVLKQK